MRAQLKVNKMSLWQFMVEKARNSELDDLEVILSEVEVILEELHLLLNSVCEQVNSKEKPQKERIKFGAHVQKYIGHNKRFVRRDLTSRCDEKVDKRKKVGESKCEKCGQSFSSRRWMRIHGSKCKGFKSLKPKWTKNAEGNFVCAVENCALNETFDSMYGLRRHFYALHVSEEEKLFACPECERKFALKNQLNEHLRVKHEKRHECELCGKKFGEKDKLRSHRFTHTGERPHQCDQCEYAAAKKYNLDAHKKAKHPAAEQQHSGCTCEICGKSFKTVGTLRGHITTVHRKEKRKNDIEEEEPLESIESIEMVSQLFMEYSEEQQQQNVSSQPQNSNYELPNLPSDFLPSILSNANP